MKPVAEAAEKVRANRRPVADDNPFLKLQEQAAGAIVAGWNAFRDWRDKTEEQLFFAMYNSPAVQAAVGVGEGVFEPRKAPAKTPEQRAALEATLAAYRADVGKGGLNEAKIRALLYVFAADRSIDERSAFALRKVAPHLAALSLDDMKRIIREQAFALLLDRDRAVQALAALAPTEADRSELMTVVGEIVDAAGKPTPETARRLKDVADLLGVEPAAQRVGQVPQPAPKAEPARKRSPAAE